MMVIAEHYSAAMLLTMDKLRPDFVELVPLFLRAQMVDMMEVLLDAEVLQSLLSELRALVLLQLRPFAPQQLT